jgi:tyrosine-protein kinase Etk/Wzc
LAEDRQQIKLNTDFNPQIIREIIRRHWFLPIIYILLLSTCAFFYLRYTKPMFRSSAKIQIIEEDRVGEVLGSENKNLPKDNQVLEKELELLKSDVLFQKVISRLNLETSIYAEGEILTQDLYRQAPFEIIIYKLKDSSIVDKRIDLRLVGKNIQLSIDKKKIGSIPVNQHLDNNFFDIYVRGINTKNIPELLSESNVYFTINNKKSLAKELKSFLNISIVDKRAKTIEISYEYYNPRLCYDMVNGLLNEYLQWERDSKQDKVNKTIQFIDAQIDSLSNILRQSKDSLNDYRRKSRILNPESMGDELNSNISELNDMLLSLDEELFTLNLISDKVNKNPNRLEIYRLIPEMVGKKSFENTLVNQIEKLNKLLESKDDLLREVTNENIQIMILNEKIKNAISNINRSMDVIEERIKNDYNTVNSKLKQLENEYFDLPEKKLEYERLKYMEEINNQYFTMFTKKKIEYELSKAGYSTSNRILTPPELPDACLLSSHCPWVYNWTWTNGVSLFNLQ